MRKNYGDDLTSYDVLKTVAIVLTVIYHSAFYFFPGQFWLFVPGVLIPIWFFLIGYARTREIPMLWAVAGVALVISNMAIGSSVFPLNILLFFILIRLMIDDVAAAVMRSAGAFIGITLLLAVLTFPTAIIFEYGTYGVLCALFGYIQRHEIRLPPPLYAFFMIILGLLTFAVVALRLPPLGAPHYVVMALLTPAGLYGLSRFKPVSWPGLRSRLPGVVPVVQFLGRWTFELYVAHLLLFRLISFYLYPQYYRFFDFQIFPFGLS